MEVAMKWSVEISQNDWEYSGYAIITANKVEKIGNMKLLADGVEIEFDEEITQPELYRDDD